MPEETVPPLRRSHRRLWILASVLALLAAAGGAGFFWLRAMLDVKAEPPPRAGDAIEVPRQVSA
ncbi:hypothetical protein, partial [Enterobacter hormaechei]